MSKMNKDINMNTEAACSLMSIVRTLSSSAGVDQREKEKKKLESSFRECDRKLDNMVTDHLNNLTSIIQAFSKISSRLSASQDKAHTIRENLLSCKHLLHCKRDELKRLWVEGIENKKIYELLDEVEKVSTVNDKLRKLFDSQHYLSYTNLLVSSLNTLENDLSGIEGLKEIKSELLQKKEDLYEKLFDELNKQIYVRATSSIIKNFQRQGSQRQSKNKSFLKLKGNDSLDSEEKAARLIMNADLKAISKPHEIIEDLNSSPDSDSVSFISILIESLSLLQRLPDAIGNLRLKIQSNLLEIIEKASQQVADATCIKSEELCQLEQPQFLLDLLELIFKQFKIIAKVHDIILAHIQRIKISMPSLVLSNLYDNIEVWNKIQSAIQAILSDYLDICNSTSYQQLVAINTNSKLDISNYFSKKRTNKDKKSILFRFNQTSHSILLRDHLREQRQENYGLNDINSSYNSSGKMIFVCKMCSSNITAIYIPLQEFLLEIEKATKVQPGTLSLQQFIKNFIKNIYLNQVQINIETSINQTVRGLDTRRKLADQHTQRSLDVSKPLLLSTVLAANHIQDLCNLMRDLPDYSDQFLNMISKILQDYLEMCQSCCQEYINSNPDDKKISDTWVKDLDINRFLRSLPNWNNLKETNLPQQTMSDEELKMMNSKESSILTTNFSGNESLILNSEIINDVGQLKTIGNLCESLEWFSNRVKDFSSSLKSPSTAPYILTPIESIFSPTHFSSLNVSENTIVTLQSMSCNFKELSELCLMTLHLEARVHCLFHLLKISKSDYCGAIDKLEPDENIVRLNKDFLSMNEVLTQCLSPKKFKYVFEGIGHLVSNVLINSAQFLRRINDNGIKKMCRNIFAVQQCLTNIINNREPDLDDVRQFYELLYLSSDEIVKSLLDRGRQFSQNEYTILLNLKHRSSPNSSDEEIERHLKKLNSILSNSCH